MNRISVLSIYLILLFSTETLAQEITSETIQTIEKPTLPDTIVDKESLTMMSTMSPAKIEFGDVVSGESKELEFFFEHKLTKDLEILDAKSTLENLTITRQGKILSNKLKLRLDAGTKGEIIKGQLILKTNSSQNGGIFILPITGNILDSIEIFPTDINFGYITDKNKDSSQTLIIKDNSGKDLRFLSVESSIPEVGVKILDKAGKKNNIRNIKIFTKNLEDVGHMFRGEILIKTKNLADIPQELAVPVSGYISSK